MQSFSNKALESRKFIWSMSEIPKLKEYLHVLKDESRQKLCTSILKAFDDEVVPVMGTFARYTPFIFLKKTDTHFIPSQFLTKYEMSMLSEGNKNEKFILGVPSTGTSTSRIS